MNPSSPPRARGVSIRGRIALLTGAALGSGLVVTWLATFAGPPPRPTPYGLIDIAEIVSGQPVSAPRARPIASTLSSTRPDRLDGWRPDPKQAAQLARLIGRRSSEVALYVRRDRAPGMEVALFPGFVAAVQGPDGWRVFRTLRGPWLTPWHRYVLGVMSLAFLLLMPLAVWAARRISRPLAELARRADALGADAPGPPPPIEGPPEVLRIRDAMERMHARVRGGRRQLEEALGAAAHDLRTPLTRLAFAAEHLPDDERTQAAADLEEIGRRLDGMLTLAMPSTAGAGRVRFDLGAMVTSLVDDRPEYRGHVRLAAHDRAVVLGDVDALRRACTHLLDNAVRFGGCARISVGRQERSALLTVEDDGPGLSPDEIERAFDPFFRSEPSRNRETGGSGLGLAVVRGVVEAHGGVTRLERQPRGGLRAVVSLPLAPRSDPRRVSA